ncbi:MAG: hypothetical protein PF692_07955 [Kiritimatiellae bacterium]|jgi:hypothetical protein|nr:hypothetical protein [Kiritimatiellia bacterium]
MKKLSIMLLSLVCGVGFAGDFIVDSYVFAEDFSWTEDIPHLGSEFVDESGVRYGVGMAVNNFNPDTICLKFSGEAYLGQVDYKGGIMNKLTGDYVPYDSDTSYYGVRGNIDMGYAFVINEIHYVMPYAGYGIDMWDRVLDAKLFEESGGYGYSELWIYSYVRIGAVSEFTITPQINFFGDLCLNVLPFTYEYITDDGQNIDLQPDGQLGFDLTVGFSYNQLLLSFFWSEKNFDKSDVEDGYYQPDSKETRIGIQAGLRF